MQLGVKIKVKSGSLSCQVPKVELAQDDCQFWVRDKRRSLFRTQPFAATLASLGIGFGQSFDLDWKNQPDAGQVLSGVVNLVIGKQAKALLRSFALHAGLFPR